MLIYCVCVWVCLIYKLRWYSSTWCQISHGHVYTFLGLDNYTGLGHGLVTLKTNAHTDQSLCETSSTLLSPTRRPSSYYTVEPLALKRAASVKFPLHKTQQHIFFFLRCVCQECQYIHKQMVVFHVSESESKQLSGEAHSICLQRIFKDMQAWGVWLPANEQHTARWYRLQKVLVGTREHNTAG